MVQLWFKSLDQNGRMLAGRKLPESGTFCRPAEELPISRKFCAKFWTNEYMLCRGREEGEAGRIRKDTPLTFIICLSDV